MALYTLDQVIGKMEVDEMAILVDTKEDPLERNTSKEGTVMFYDEKNDYILKFKHNKQDVVICKGFNEEPCYWYITKRDF